MRAMRKLKTIDWIQGIPEGKVYVLREAIEAKYKFLCQVCPACLTLDGFEVDYNSDVVRLSYWDRPGDKGAKEVFVSVAQIEGEIMKVEIFKRLLDEVH